MKKFLAGFIIVSLVMALLAGGFVSIPSAKALSVPSVTVTPNVVGQFAKYKVEFTLGAALAAGDEIWLYFPKGTILPCTECNSRILRTTVTVNGVCPILPSIGNRTTGVVQVFVPNALKDGEQVTLIIDPSAHIRNSTVTGTYVLGISTSAEPKRIDSTPFDIYASVTYTVTFDAQGGTPTTAPITAIAYGTTVLLPEAPTKAGFTFTSWNTIADGTGTTFAGTTPVIADRTVYATYLAIPEPVPVTYTVTFDAQGGSPTPAPITGIAEGAFVTLPEAPILTGSTFASWNTIADGTGTTFDGTTPISAAITVYATYILTPVPTPTPPVVEPPVVEPPVVLVLQIGKPTFMVNNTLKTLDTPPVIKNERTLVPIRAIIEALGGSVGWDGTVRKATVVLGTTTINLWIGNNIATVDGEDTPIDAANAKVVPEIINGRTMLPLRFISENLGATVNWEASSQTITITYPK